MSGAPAPAAAGAGARSNPRPRRRVLRFTLAAIASLLLLALVVALSAPWWFDARRVSALALDRAGATTGLEWRIAGEPELKWRPRPWLALPSLSIRDGQGRLVLGAERLEIALPWSTLRGESLRVEALSIDKPDIDLKAALAWWDAQPPGDAQALPVIDGITVREGRIRWEGGSVEGLQLALPRFAVGEAMALAASGTVRLAPDDPEAAPAQPFDIAIDLKATPQPEPLRLEGVRMGLSGSGPIPSAEAAGRLQFAPWQLQLDGAIAAWPTAWPALPAPLSSSTTPIAFSVSQQGESALGAEATLVLRRDEASFDARARPEALLAWLDDAAGAVLPPLHANATLPSLELDGVRLDGVSVEIEEIEESESAEPRP